MAPSLGLSAHHSLLVAEAVTLGVTKDGARIFPRGYLRL